MPCSSKVNSPPPGKQCRRQRPSCEENPPPRRTTGYALVVRGQLELAEGRVPQAQATLEQALTLLQPEDRIPDDVAEAKFTLARALWSDGKERQRAVQLAQRARELYETSGPKNHPALAKVKRWLNDHH
jgi:hypothetical protein